MKFQLSILLLHYIPKSCRVMSELSEQSLVTTRCTQREQNARLHVTSLSSDIKYCKEDNKIKPNM